MTSSLSTADPRWHGQRCIVAASGPGLTPEVADACRGEHVIAVNDAYRRLPFAEVLFATDAAWWRLHEGCRGFAGERWSSHGVRNDKSACAARYGLRLIRGTDVRGFSFDPGLVHYGNNSGYAAVNLALNFGANPIVLVGFDMRAVDGKRHFFGDHPAGIQTGMSFSGWIDRFDDAAKRLPPGRMIINATPNSALRCFPMVDLAAVLAGRAAA